MEASKNRASESWSYIESINVSHDSKTDILWPLPYTDTMQYPEHPGGPRVAVVIFKTNVKCRGSDRYVCNYVVEFWIRNIDADSASLIFPQKTIQNKNNQLHSHETDPLKICLIFSLKLQHKTVHIWRMFEFK